MLKRSKINEEMLIPSAQCSPSDQSPCFSDVFYEQQSFFGQYTEHVKIEHINTPESRMGWFGPEECYQYRAYNKDKRQRITDCNSEHECEDALQQPYMEDRLKFDFLDLKETIFSRVPSNNYAERNPSDEIIQQSLQVDNCYLPFSLEAMMNHNCILKDKVGQLNQALEPNENDLSMQFEWEEANPFDGQKTNYGSLLPVKKEVKPTNLEKLGSAKDRKHFFPHFMILLRSCIRQRYREVEAEYMIVSFGLEDSNTFSKKKFLSMLQRPEIADTFERLVQNDEVLQTLDTKTKHKFLPKTKNMIRNYYPSIKQLILSKGQMDKFRW